VALSALKGLISELRERHFEGDRVMMGLLGGVIIALLAANANSIPTS
jgi:putative ABC transport system permease protein